MSKWEELLKSENIQPTELPDRAQRKIAEYQKRVGLPDDKKTEAIKQQIEDLDEDIVDLIGVFVVEKEDEVEKTIEQERIKQEEKDKKENHSKTHYENGYGSLMSF